MNEEAERESTMQGMNIDLRENLRKIVERCKNDRVREYEMAITSIVEDADSYAETLCSKLKSIISDEDADISYAAFFALVTYHRRQKNVRELEMLFETYSNEFKVGGRKSHDSYAFLKLMFDKMSHNRNLNRLIEEASNLCEIMGKENCGVLHCFSELVAEAYEVRNNGLNTTEEELIKKAISTVTEAINRSKEPNAFSDEEPNDGYPKFYFTLGRLYFVGAINCKNRSESLELFNKATHEIDIAVDYEKSAARMADYQIKCSRLQADYYKATIEYEMKVQRKQIDSSLNEMNTKNLEFLGFFAAVVSFTIGSIQIVKEFQFETVATLIIVLTGCLMTAFGGFGFLLHGLNREKLFSTFLVIIFGVMIIVAALWYGRVYV
ncbi:MAG: hypothetical protein RR413_11700 [Christensenellaceae bacterium]